MRGALNLFRSLLMMFLLLSFGLGCQKGEPTEAKKAPLSCESTCAHLIALAGQSPKLLNFRDTTPQWSEALTARCLQDCSTRSWSKEALQCAMSVKSLEEADACEGLKGPQ